MIHLPSTPRTFLELLGIAIRHHFVVLREIVLLVVFLVIVKDATVYLGGLPSNPYLYSLVIIVMLLLILYLLSAMLYTAHCVLYNERVDWRTALSDTLTSMGHVMLAFIILTVVPVVWFIVVHWFVHRSMVGNPRSAGLVIVLLAGIPVMIAYIYYLFTIPLIVAEDFGVWQAFKQAPLLVGQAWWNIVRVFGLYACGMAVWILVSPDTLHGHFMKMYKLSAPFDFIVFCVTLPILLNFVILLRSDLRLRKEIANADLK